METKLHIEVNGNVLDVEGDGNFVESVYNDFTKKLSIANKTDWIIPSDKIDADEQDVAPLVAMTHR